jgi:UDP-glucose 4-epimerase
MQIKGRRFLVTGGSGFIGSHVVDQLLASDAEAVAVFDKKVRRENLSEALPTGRVRILDGDVTDREALRDALQDIHGVFHMAVLPIGACVESPRTCLDVNVIGTFNVLEASHEAGVEKIVFSSASSVYGDTDETMDESHPLDAMSMYGATKVAGEFFLRAFHDMYGLDYVTLRYMNVYGPRQEGGLVMSVLSRIRSGEPPAIAGDGSQSFDFIHVADVASANVQAMASDVTNGAFNVGSGGEASVGEIVELLLKLSGSALRPQLRTDQKVLMKRRVGSNDKAIRQLGWRPTYDLERGLGELVSQTS